MDRSRFQAAVGIAAALLLLVVAYAVLEPFLVSITWAAILAYVTWPVHRAIRRALGGRNGWAAAVTTLLVILAIVLPVTFLSMALAAEARAAYRTAVAWGGAPPPLPAWVVELPLVGPWLEGWYGVLRADPAMVQGFVVERAGGLSKAVLSAAGDVGRNLLRLALTLLTAFFLYRHGERLVAEMQQVLDRLTGDVVRRRLALVGATVRGVCYGVLLTALAQGLLAGVGFAIFGVRGAVLLGALTALLALVPVGPPLVWVPVALWVLATASVWKGVALLVWGALVVSGIDNVLRPYFIGGATQTPFLLVFFGVVGGLASFGLLGLFVGPLTLAILLALWREWAREEA